MQFRRKGGSGRLNGAFISCTDEGAHILLMKRDAPKRDQQQKQSERQNRDGKQLHSEAAQKRSGRFFHSSAISPMLCEIQPRETPRMTASVRLAGWILAEVCARCPCTVRSLM